MLMIGTFHLPSVLLSLCSWGSIYYVLRRLEPQRKPEWHCRIVTVIHATFITILSTWAAFIQGPWPFTDAGGPNTPLQVQVTTICLGYFLFDFSWCLYFQTEGPPMLLHHSLSIIGLVWTLCSGKYGTEMVATICGSEVTNPLLQLRWFVKETGHYHSILGEVVDVLFFVAFFTLRIGVGSVMLYSYFQQPTDFWGRLGAVCIYLIGWMFWVSIFQYAVYKYKKKYRAWRSQQHAGATSTVTDAPHGKEKTRETDAGIDCGGERSTCTERPEHHKNISKVSKNCHGPSSAGNGAPTKSLSNGVHHRNTDACHTSMTEANGSVIYSAEESTKGTAEKKEL